MSFVPLNTQVEMKLALGWSAERICEELKVKPRFVAEVARYLEMVEAGETEIVTNRLRGRLMRDA